ncbi:sigma-70 family RNA polymerase sigma factor [Amycolatopsis keratiniphila]|uniref:sigma-70 family RNA polymerase sigma factor n=1 Tax=Amycolatopsis keratiniphila TaxID=129921 RepID=UPI0034047B74
MDLSLPETGPASGVFSLRRSDMRAGDGGVFDAAITTFGWLVTGPHPVCVDGAAILGLPARPVPLDELGALLLSEGCTQATRDAAWTYLVTRARAEGGTWTMACVGLAMPVLLPVAAQLTNRFRGDKHDIHAAVLAGFLARLGEVALDRPAILVRLRWAAYRAGYTALREALDAAPPIEDIGVRSTPPHRPGGHPDLVLVTAVRAGVITTDEAALISATRFGELSLTEAAHARGQSYKAAQQARRRAEQRLARYLTDPVDDPADDTSTPAPATPGRGHTSAPHHPALRLSRTHRLRLRSVTRVSPALAKKFVRPVSPQGSESGVSTRGTRPAARPHRHHPPGPARRSALTQEAPSCD